MNKITQKTQIITAAASAIVLSASCAQSQPQPSATTKAAQPTSSTRRGAQVASQSNIVNRVRLFPRAGFASRLVGARIQGSNLDATSGFVDLAVIKKAPAEGKWTTFVVKNAKTYKYVRLFAPSGSWGNVAEVEFLNGTTKIQGQTYGTFGSRDNSGNTFDKAFDGDTKTFYDAPTPNSQYVGIEIKSGETSSTQSAPVMVGNGLRHYHMGNSLTDTIGEYTQQIALAAGYKDDFVDRQTIPGAPLYLNEQSDGGFGTNHKIAFEKHAPLTDLVMQTFIQNGDSDKPEFSLKLYEKARVKSPDIRPWIYGQWDVTGDGINGTTPSWEGRNMSYMRMYMAHVLNFNAQTKGKKAQLVPGGLGLINLKKAIEAGKVPGMTNFAASNFEDDLHVNMNGRYFIGLVTYAALYNKSPEGLPVVKINDKPPTLTPAQNKAYQQIAWDTVKTLNSTGASSLGITLPAEIDARAVIGRSPVFYNDPMVRYISEKSSFSYLLTAPAAGKYDLKVNMSVGKPDEKLEVFLNQQKAGVITPNVNGDKPFVDAPPLTLNLKAGLNLLRLYVPTNRPYEINTLRITPVGGKLKNTMPFLGLSTFGAESKGGAPFVVSFPVSDEETKPAELKVTATSDNTKLVTNEGVKLESDASATNGKALNAGYKLTVSPVAGQTGDTDIIVTVTDGGGIARSHRFKLSVK